MLIRAFKQAWEYSTSMDSSVIIVDETDGGRRCLSGREVWTEDVMTVMDQCIQLPGEISAMLLDLLRIACSSGGCSALSQMQKVIRVDSAAESIVELLALRLDRTLNSLAPGIGPLDPRGTMATGVGRVASQADLERVYGIER